MEVSQIYICAYSVLHIFHMCTTYIYVHIFRICKYIEAAHLWRLKLCIDDVYAHIWKLGIYKRLYGTRAYIETEVMHNFFINTYFPYMYNFYIYKYFPYICEIDMLYTYWSWVYKKVKVMLNFCICAYMEVTYIWKLCISSVYAQLL